MTWQYRLKQLFRRTPPSLTECPDCGREMILVERITFSGSDMRSYRCEKCGKEHIVNFGVALWKILADDAEATERQDRAE